MYSAEKGRTVSTKTARPAETEERTRDRVLQGVLTHGPVSAAKLGELLNLTPAAVRRHLDALEKNNLIEVASHRQHGAGAGRPARRYVIAPQGHSELGNDYLDIARDALTMLKDAVGEDALRQFASARANDMAERYRPIVEAAGDDVSARAEALAEAMTHDGFVATANEMAPAVGLSCPITCWPPSSSARATAPCETSPKTSPSSATRKPKSSPNFSGSMCADSPPWQVAPTSAPPTSRSAAHRRPPHQTPKKPQATPPPKTFHR